MITELLAEEELDVPTKSDRDEQSRALLGQPSPTNNGAVWIYTSRGYKKHHLGGKKKLERPLLRVGME